MLSTISQDLRFAWRGLRRTPAFAMVAIGSLALGIGANTAIFSFVNAILLKRLPVPEPQQMVQIAAFESGKETSTVFSYPFLAELNKSTLFAGVAGRFPVRVNLTGANSSEPLNGEMVTGAYFRTLEVKAALGRLLNENDIAAGSGNPVCVLSYATWQERFDGDPHIIGRTLLLNAHAYRVVGVTQRRFRGAQMQARVDMQLPVSRMGDFMGGVFGTGVLTWRSAGFSWLAPLARLKPGMSAARAQAMLQPVAQGIQRQLAYPNNRGQSDQKTVFRLLDGSQGANTDQRRREPLLVLMGIVGLILLIACMNVASLLLARAKAREKEFALRLSLGAGRVRLARQLLAESVAIAALGGLLGIFFSTWLIQILLFYFNEGSNSGEGLQVRLDPLVLCFAIGVSLLTAVLFGLAPAWQSTQVDVLSGLKEAQTGHTAGSERAALRKLLTIGQLALSVCLLFGAGLLTRTLSHLETVDLGFKPAQVVALSIDPAMAGYRAKHINGVFDEIVRRLKRDPRIAAASYATVSPLDGSLITLDVDVPGHPASTSDVTPAFNDVSPGYFDTIRQKLLAGRDISAHDTSNAPRVAIVSELFAKHYFGRENPIGHRFKQGGGDVQIVGVAADAHYDGVRDMPIPAVYLAAAQSQSSGHTLLVRARQSAGPAIPEIEHVIRALDARLPVYNVRTLQAQIDNDISSERILSFLSELFAALAVLLCGIGLYGIVAYGVTMRTREIGIRLALGATRPRVAKLFLLEVLLLLAAGIGAGIPLALGAAGLVKNLLFGLQANDAGTMALILLLLVVTSLGATVLPVRKAVHVEPLEALHYE